MKMTLGSAGGRSLSFRSPFTLINDRLFSIPKPDLSVNRPVAKTMRIAIVILSSIILIACSDRNKRLHVTERLLPTGDMLIQEQRPMNGWVESTLHNSLFVQWKDSKRRELIRDGGPALLSKEFDTAIWKGKECIAIKIRNKLYFRPEPSDGRWRIWWMGSNPELFASIRSALDREGVPYRQKSENGRSVINWGQSDGPMYEISDSIGSFSLPYDIESVDFEANQIIAKSKTRIAGLPEILVFGGSASHFGRWVCHGID